MSGPRETAARVAWITGGGTGIGKALAARLCREGYAVAISGRRADVLQEALKELLLLSSYQQVIALPLDVADDTAVQKASFKITEALGSVDLLINNAGWNPMHAWDGTTPAEFHQAFAINCLGPIHAIRAVLPEMRRRGTGQVINISSVLGHWASATSAAYSVSKYALTGVTDVLRQELIETPIQVLGVYPGFIETAMTKPFVKSGSWKGRLGASPDAMAAAILRALAHGKTELYYPAYVSWLIRLHRWAPRWADRLARRVHP